MAAGKGKDSETRSLRMSGLQEEIKKSNRRRTETDRRRRKDQSSNTGTPYQRTKRISATGV